MPLLSFCRTFHRKSKYHTLNHQLCNLNFVHKCLIKRSEKNERKEERKNERKGRTKRKNEKKNERKNCFHSTKTIQMYFPFEIII